MIDKPNNFLIEIDKICRSKNIEYIDAILHWCKINNLEIEIVANMIKRDQNLKFKVQIEAQNLNYMKKSASLPI
jgi:hypothetical protein